MYIKCEDRKLLNNVCECCDNDNLPSNINNWFEQSVFKNNRYMFYKSLSEGDKLCFCQNCKKQNMKINVLISKKYVVCPNCHKRMKLKNIKYKVVYDSDYFHYLTQYDNESFILRTFRVIRDSNFLTVKYVTLELERHLFKLDFFNSNVYYNKYFRLFNFSWTLGCYNNMNYYLSDCLFVYNKNLDILNRGFLKYFPFKKICCKNRVDLFLILKNSFNFIQMEYILKLGLTNLLKQIDCLKYLDLDYSQNDIRKFFKLSSNYYKFFIKHNLSFSQLEYLYKLQFFNIRPTLKNIEFMNLIYDVFYDYDIFSLINFISLKKYYFKYILTKDNFKDYRDYLDYAKKLNYDLKNTMYLKPKNLKIAHDMAMNKYNSIKNVKLYRKVKSVLKRYFNLSYTGNKYSIVIPNSAEDIVQEGCNMNNCVSTYLSRISRNESIICFLRHSNDLNKSFYTIEVNPSDYSIVQCRGYNNGITSEESQVRKFVKSWEKMIKNRLLA